MAKVVLFEVMRILFVALLMIVAVECVQKEYREMFYQKGDAICNINQRIWFGCAKKMPDVDGKFTCMLQCEEDDFCVGVSMSDAGLCFLHEVCQSEVSCTDEDEKHTVTWYRYCVHGHWDKTTQSCVCSHGCTGVRCDGYISNCGGLISRGYSSGKYRALVDYDSDGKHPLKLTCSIVLPDYWNVEVMINEAGFEINRPWKDYANGFFQDAGNFWIGLQNWHLLSSAGYTFLVVVFRYNEDYNVNRAYTNFVVADKERRYSFSFDTSEPNSRKGLPPAGDYFGDCLGPLQNVPFSTWDRDVDEDIYLNCAAWRGTGWWFRGCDSTCNLFGWGLDDWEDTPPHRRLAVPGVDMEYRVRQNPTGIAAYVRVG